jgi:ParB family transcriptional regulator, chromosome partitioning protein
MLGHIEIPALVINDDEQGCMVRSLVENVARRNHSATELLRELDFLKKAGNSDAQVAEKVGLSVAYLHDLLFLLERGEERLLTAVEVGTIPIGLAIQIAKASDVDVQRALADAYTEGALNGRQIAVVRRLIQRRIVAGGALSKAGVNTPESKVLTPERLRRMYVKAGDKQRVLVKKAEVVHARLLFIVEALRDLLSNPEFADLLKREGFSTLPRALEKKIFKEPS